MHASHRDAEMPSVKVFAESKSGDLSRKMLNLAASKTLISKQILSDITNLPKATGL